MIEVKNLKKTYVTKGTTTHALDDVSIKFPEKGMVFLLGKTKLYSFSKESMFPTKLYVFSGWACNSLISLPLK